MMAFNQDPQKRQPLLPEDKAGERPLFIVLAVLAFLACFTLLCLQVTHQVSNQWRIDIAQTATIQIKPGQGGNENALARTAKDILAAMPSVSQVKILSKEHSIDLLKPWLGSAALPEGLPLPILLEVKLESGKNIDKNSARKRLAAAGVQADIDDHSYWRRDLRKNIRAVQTLSILAFILIFLAIFSACVFATHAGIERRRTLMNVLHQIGASPPYTAQLFSKRFALSSFKAGIFGAACAFCVLFVFSLVTRNVSSDTFLLPKFVITPSHIYLSMLIPLLMALISGLTAWRTVTKRLLSELYP